MAALDGSKHQNATKLLALLIKTHHSTLGNVATYTSNEAKCTWDGPLACIRDGRKSANGSVVMISYVK